jgi:hypothetical protein
VIKSTAFAGKDILEVTILEYTEETDGGVDG